MSFEAICQSMSNRKAPVEALPHHEVFASQDARSGFERERIVDVGERLVRHFGHRKTTVADIASDLRTSRANVYRFFPTKDAIDQHVCGRVIDQTLEALRQVAGENQAATARLEKLVEHLYQQNIRRVTEEPHVHELLLVAMEQSWGVARRYFAETARLVEAVVRDGLVGGEFNVPNPAEAAKCVVISIMPFIHPSFARQPVFTHQNMNAELGAQIRFLIGSLQSRC